MTDLTERLIEIRDAFDSDRNRLDGTEVRFTLAAAIDRLTDLEDERNAIGDELVAARADNDRLVPENKRLREALERIANGDYLEDSEGPEGTRGIARAALASVQVVPAEWWKERADLARELYEVVTAAEMYVYNAPFEGALDVHNALHAAKARYEREIQGD